MRKIDLERWQVYFRLRDEGHAVEKAARGSKIDPKTAWRFERNEAGSTGIEAAAHLGITHVGGLEVAPELPPDANRALGDFAFFRRRYFGRVSMPWQEKAAYDVLDKLNTEHREFGVVNSPPGGGKSTLFTHDIPAWLLARNRAIRIQIGSGSERQANWYVGRLKKTLERAYPLQAEDEAKDLGLSHDAYATLPGDYGAFRPEGRTDLWRAEALVVRQFSGMALDDKEPSVSGWGQDSKFLGGRFDFIIWDDLVNGKNTLGKEAGQNLIEWWITEAETRLEPGGLLILQGQRIAPDDLYRFNLDRTDLEGRPKYFHVRFQAHDDGRCQGNHDPATSLPQPSGCLLDPYRLPWRELSGKQADTPRVYDISYQQNDGTSAGALVELAWIEGGRDSTGLETKGCFDTGRSFGVSGQPDFKGWSVVSVDPSPSEYWGITRWVMVPERHIFELCGSWRRKLGSEAFLSMDLDDQVFSGLLEEIRADAANDSHPLQAVIIEVNAAQKWLLAQPHMRRWAQVHGVTLLPHTTAINKADPEYGVKGIADFFRQGAIRIPHGNPAARLAARPLIHELTTWPDGVTDDLVMSVWFAIRAVQMTYANPDTPAPHFNRPDWLGNGRALTDVYGGRGAYR